MSAPNVALHDVVSTLRAEHLLGDDGLAYLDSRPGQQPWYIRAMVGFGAWLASLLLIGFVASFSILVDGGYAFIGLGTDEASLAEGQQTFASGKRIDWRLR